MGQMIGIQSTIKLSKGVGRNGNVIPNFVVLGDQYLSMMKLKSGDLSSRGTIRHEFEPLFYEAVVIYVNIVAEAYGLLALQSVFVNTAELIWPLDLPMLGHISNPVNSGGFVRKVCLIAHSMSPSLVVMSISGSLKWNST